MLRSATKSRIISFSEKEKPLQYIAQRYYNRRLLPVVAFNHTSKFQSREWLPLRTSSFFLIAL